MNNILPARGGEVVRAVALSRDTGIPTSSILGSIVAERMTDMAGLLLIILMASRRLKSDRFFTDDYRAEIYTREGIDWVESNTMISVLTRHYPELAPAMYGIESAFNPWHEIGG